MGKDGNRKKQLRWLRPIMVLFVLAGLFMLYQKVNYERRDFYEEYYSDYPPASLESNSQRLGMTLAMELYNGKEYGKAIPVLDMVVKNPSYKESGHLYRGLCKMNLNKFWEAISDFEIAKTSASTIEAAEWYKILCYIGLEATEGNERKDDAIELLQYYVDNPQFEFKKADARKLLSEY